MKLLLLALLLFLCSCHRHQGLLEGEIKNEGQLVAGAKLRLMYPPPYEQENCHNLPVLAVTDGSGKFSARIKKFPVIPCIEVNGRIYADAMILDDHRNKTIELRCTLPVVVTGHFEDGHLCH